MNAYTFTSSPLPVNGTYGCGETVTFCYTVTNWNSVNSNWFHGIGISFGPGWDLATLTPGAPPATFGTSNGTWGWYNSVNGTGWNTIGSQGPGFFFDLDNDGNPGNNFGDYAIGAVNWQFCWTISVLSGPDCINGLDLSVAVNSFSDSETGAWGSVGCHNDPVGVSTPAVIQACSANAGTSTSVTYCTEAAPVELLSLLGGTPDATGTWTGPSGGAFSGSLDPSTGVSGTYTYLVNDLGGGCSAQATVDVTLHAQPDAGTDATTTVCTSSAAFGLLALLGSSADPGGTWIAPDGSPFSGTFTPATDAGGIYSYQLVGSAPCVSVQSQVTVVVNPSVNAGGNGTLTLCSTGLPTSLFTFLTGTPAQDGVWTGPDQTVTTGTYIPQVSPPGVYSYTVQGTAPCPNSVAGITVTENAQPNAGGDAAISFCETDAAEPLVGLLGGTPDQGGSWTDPLGAAVGPTLDPSTAIEGNYTYMLDALAPCLADQAMLAITIHAQPSAGGSGVLDLCEGSAPSDLFLQLSGTPDVGGIWTDVNGTTTGALFNPATQAPGLFTYTLDAEAPCAAAHADVIVSISSQPNAGNDASATACSSDADVALFPLLGFSVTPTGAWTDPSGATATGTFSPGTSLDGEYTYTIPATAPCTSVSAVVNMSTTAAADAGSNGSVSLCNTSDPVDLFSSLNGTPSPGGSWTNTMGVSTNSMLDPSVAGAGAYTYTLPINGPCAAASAQVSVTIAEAPDAGNSATLSVCSSAADLALFNELDGTPESAGTWTAPNGSAHGPTYDPAVDPSGEYTYTIEGVAPCSAASATVTITNVGAISAGEGEALAICENAALLDLFGNLNGAPTPGGTWTGPNGAALVQLDPGTASSGNYTYTVTGTTPCPNDQAVVPVTIDLFPFSGSDGNISACMDADAFNLFSQLGGTAWSTGTWSGPSGPATGLFTPGLNVPGTYTYFVSGSGACAQESAASTVLVAINPLPVPSIIASTVLGCIPLEVDFKVGNLQSVGSASWQFGDGGTSSSIVNTQHTYTGPGEFTVRLVVTDANGCTGSVIASDLIRTSSGPSAFFYATPEKVSTAHPEVSVVRVDEPLVATAWTIDGGELDQVGSFNWTFGSTTAVHEICLTATDTLGCANTLCQLVFVDDVLTAFVPNAFTPDGDGLNDVFLPSVIGLDIDTYTFSVFDRWGNEVFSTTDPQEGWNGGFGNAGAIQQPDVYVWRVLARDQFTADRKELFGTATLVK